MGCGVGISTLCTLCMYAPNPTPTTPLVGLVVGVAWNKLIAQCEIIQHPIVDEPFFFVQGQLRPEAVLVIVRCPLYAPNLHAVVLLVFLRKQAYYIRRRVSGVDV